MIFLFQCIAKGHYLKVISAYQIDSDCLLPVHFITNSCIIYNNIQWSKMTFGSFKDTTLTWNNEYNYCYNFIVVLPQYNNKPRYNHARDITIIMNVSWILIFTLQFMSIATTSVFFTTTWGVLPRYEHLPYHVCYDFMCYFMVLCVIIWPLNTWCIKLL